MDRNNLVLGGVALVVGVLVGLLFAPRGASIEEIEAVIDERLASIQGAATGTGDSISSLQTQIGESATELRTELENSVAALQSQVDRFGERIGVMEAAIADSASEQAARAESLSSEISERFDSIGSVLSEQGDTMRSRLDGLRSSLFAPADDGGTGEVPPSIEAPPAPAAEAPAEGVEETR